MVRHVFQFKITLLDSNPSIWRRIQIADACTFFDLHVAIQDSMGWADYHLHDFRVKSPYTSDKRSLRIGIPSDDDYDEPTTLAGWDLKVSDYITTNKTMRYLYDYGDNWDHEVTFEGSFPRIVGTKYPLCLDGEKSCPPEDCGGMHLYNALLLTLNDKNHPDHEDNLEWLGEEFAPDKFDAKKVKFSNASTRLKRVLENTEMGFD